MKKRVVIRADGGISIGMGHVIRSLALADMLRNEFAISFAIQSTDKSIEEMMYPFVDKIIHLPVTDEYNSDVVNFGSYLNATDIVVLDGYHFETDYQRAIKKIGCKLVVIDDLHSWHQVADVVINHAEGVSSSLYSTESYTKLCLGLDFVLLRKEFLKGNGKTREIKNVKKVFISMGAADINNLTEKYTKAILGIKSVSEVHLMLGGINPHLKELDLLTRATKKAKIVPHFNIPAHELAELLGRCDLCICPASSISLESCAVGLPVITGITAENQRGILNGLLKHGAVISLGDLLAISPLDIKAKLEVAINKIENLNDLIKNQSKMIDGKSPGRIVNVFETL